MIAHAELGLYYPAIGVQLQNKSRESTRCLPGKRYNKYQAHRKRCQKLALKNRGSNAAEIGSVKKIRVLPRKVGLPKRQVTTKVWSRELGFTTARATVTDKQTYNRTMGQQGVLPPQRRGGSTKRERGNVAYTARQCRDRTAAVQLYSFMTGGRRVHVVQEFNSKNRMNRHSNGL